MTPRTPWRLVRRPIQACISLLALVLLYMLAALLLGLLTCNRDYRPTPDGIDVFIRSNGVHTDIALPVAALGIDWRRRLPLASWQTLAPEAYLAFGWGDRKFYLETPSWNDLKLSTALLALSGADDALLHVEAIARPRPGARVRHLRLSPAAYRQLVRDIDAQFAPTPNGTVAPIAGAHYSRDDVFFAAQGHYSLFITCNEWSRQRLARAGVRSPLWSPFDWALMRLPSD